MKPVYQDIMETIMQGNSHKFILQDGASISFTKRGRNRYRMVLKDTNGIKKDSRDLNDSGLQFMFQKFSDQASYVSIHKGE